jgi:hypothetical protein
MAGKITISGLYRCTHRSARGYSLLEAPILHDWYAADDDMQHAF